MKKKTINVIAAMLVLVLGVLATGCLKTNDDATPLPSPNGKFTGIFKKLKLNAGRTGYDTVKKSTLTITLKTDSGFKVTGDTTLHAGSHGTFDYNYYYMGFDDATHTDTAKKVHLNGVYQYYYDGKVFQLLRNLDTVKYTYDLRKAD